MGSFVEQMIEFEKLVIFIDFVWILYLLSLSKTFKLDIWVVSLFFMTDGAIHPRQLFGNGLLVNFLPNRSMCAAEFSEAVVENPEDAHKNEPTILFERKTRFDFVMY